MSDAIPKVEHTSFGTYTITWTPEQWRAWRERMQRACQKQYDDRAAWGLFVEVNGNCYCGAKLDDSPDARSFVKAHIECASPRHTGDEDRSTSATK